MIVGECGISSQNDGESGDNMLPILSHASIFQIATGFNITCGRKGKGRRSEVLEDHITVGWSEAR